ncbi:MAG: histidine kinase N-terminal 7TM domain-containing protein [Peptococcaceae bacterium]|jgi:signal transduction histidine kinase|nr:ATP-binding protein [Peptococcaceae bacterium]MDH7526304.1 histidine kinase N-terminal 7TM domain-containing protein [Peptococcaceae bacterium]
MNFSFALLHIAALMVVVLFLFTLRVKKKNQLHHVFLTLLASIMAWTTGNILAWWTYLSTGQVLMAYVNIWYLGNCYTPLFLYFFAILSKGDRLDLSGKHRLIFLPPTISYLTLLTNEFNGRLFFKNFSLMNSQVVFGPMFYFHTFVSYIFLSLAIYHLLSFAVKNTGLFSRQSLLTLTAALCPIVINVVITLKIYNLPVYFTSIGFAFTVAAFWFSMAKYQFLNLTPIAMQTILDRMTDGFAVIDEKNRITYHNKAFINTFKSFEPKLMSDIIEIFKNRPSYTAFAEMLADYVDMVKSSGRTLSFDQWLRLDNEERYFQVDVTPILASENKTNALWGLLVLFKDTTQIHRAIETIKKNQTMMMEQQHLASLGQLIGGIAHNLRTPIMSIAGGLESLRDLAYEYQISIDDNNVTEDDHREIAAEMLSWVNKIKPFCSYMSDIISTVKDQAVRLNESSMSKFTIAELLKRVELLMRHELKKGHCTLNISNHTSPETELPGTMNNMIQILGNIIVNAIEAYEDMEGRIDLTVEPCSINPRNTRISVRDYGPGIPESIRDKLFKEMVTTKGRKGTGLGLYLSYLTIKGKFGGDMWFESATGQGTAFHISVPTLQKGLTGGNGNEKTAGTGYSGLQNTAGR